MSQTVTGNVQGFDQLVQAQGAVVQGAGAAADPPISVTLSSGGIVLALLQAWASVVLWLQGLILGVLAASRLGSSTGNDVDTFVGQFGLTRIPATSAGATVTVGRYLDTAVAYVQVGLLLTTADNSQQFAVIADATQPTWSATLGEYVIPANTATAAVSVAAVTPGTAGNVQAGTITQISASAPGLDYVSNAGAATGGANQESDAQLQARFALYIQGLSRATLDAIEFAVSSAQPGITYNVIEDYNYDGVWTPGYVTVVVNDGSGDPPSSLKNAVAALVEQYRGATIQYGVFGPTTVAASVAFTLTVQAGFTKAVVAAQVTAALTSYIQSLAIGVPLLYFALPQVIYAVAGVASIEGLLVNGATADVSATGVQVVVPGTMTVS